MLGFTKYPSGNVWLHDIGTVVISSDSPYVDFALAADETEIFQNRYHPYQSSITIIGLDELADTYMRENNLAYCSFQMKITDSTESSGITRVFSVLYSSRIMSLAADDWSANRFLTTVETLLIDQSSDLSLAMIASSTDKEYSLFVCGTDSVGNQLTDKHTLPVNHPVRGKKLVYLPVSPADVLRLCAEKDIRQVLSYSITCGNRSITVFVRQLVPPNIQQFRFRNIFSVFENISLQGKIVRKTTTKRESAIIARQTTVFYTLSTREYELSTTLTFDEAMRVEDMMESPEVTDAQGKAVILTNEDLSVDNIQTSLKQLTLSWKYADAEPTDHTVLHESSNIFSQQYDKQFS